MADETSLKEIVVEEATSQLDGSDLLEGNFEDGIDFEELGVAAGGRIGERMGRSVGESIGESVHEALSTALEEGKSLREILADLKTAIVDAIRKLIGGEESERSVPDVSDAMPDTEIGEEVAEAAPTELLEDEEADGEEPPEDEEAEEPSEDETGEEESDVEEPEPEDEEADDGDEEATDPDDEDVDEGEGEDVDEGEGEVTDAEEGEEDGPSAADLEDLKRETLEDFLDVMSYRDLQSVAKDVGVKANLGREEMTEEIVETVSVETAEEKA